MEENIKYESIPYDAIIDIQISGTFYRQLANLFNALAESVPLEEFKNILEKIKDNDPPKSTFELNIHSLISIISEIETKAQQQKKTKQIIINSKTGQQVIES